MPSVSKIPIHFFSELPSFQLKDRIKLRAWLTHVAVNQHYTFVNLNYVFCSDDYLLEINQHYLNHDTLTDIITFDYCIGKTINGEIYISVERVKENAKERSVSFKDELHRVMVHGILHLTGFKDKTKEQQTNMRAQEDLCLNLRSF
jgi:probable rRNA maturation factor